jgi:hypothetical protein
LSEDGSFSPAQKVSKTFPNPGADVMIILNIFAEKFSKKLAFLTQNKAKLCKNVIITLVFEKNANFFAENWQKSQKSVIITSIPVANPTTMSYNASAAKKFNVTNNITLI